MPRLPAAALSGHAVRNRAGAGVVVLLCVLSSTCDRNAATTPSRLGADAALWARMLAAEDARGGTEDGLAPVFEGLHSANPAIRAIAARGLGRLERPDLADSIAPLLDDGDASVRADAANALGQAVHTGDPAPVRVRLLGRLPTETDAAVRGVIAETLGRLAHADATGIIATADALTGIAAGEESSNGDGGDAVRLGVARGFHFLARQRFARRMIPDTAIATLRGLTMVRAGSAELERQTRRVAAAALTSAGGMQIEDIERLLRDDDPFVRREAAVAIATVSDPGVGRHLVERALADSSAAVRYEAVRQYDRVRDPETACRAIVDATLDANAHVALVAIDLLASDCAGPDGAMRLDSLAAMLPADQRDVSADWHPAAHALVSLASVAPRRASGKLPEFVTAGNGFVRAWAARAATALSDTAALTRLAADADPNVRAAAIAGLAAVSAHGADSIYLAQLADQNDSQLLQAAANALEGTTDPRAPPALLDALDRISVARRETWRDARVALLTRAASLGDAMLAGRVQPYLEDYDAAVAGLAASAIGDWTGTKPDVSPRLLPRLALPTDADTESLVGADVTIEFADGGRIALELLPFDAPTNAFRFARLARTGYYDGLTFHRVAPNFVVQGGSPAANEYSGDGPYTRDELGLAHNWRGTVGLSTRGRDTGDAQLYINLIDNVRLDGDYTIFARVTAGMDVVDRLLEGAVIRRIRVQ